MNYPKEARNKAIVLLRKLDPQTYKYKVLGELLPNKIGQEYRPMDPSTVEQVYKRDVNKYPVKPTSRAIEQAQKAGYKDAAILTQFSVVEDG